MKCDSALDWLIPLIVVPNKKLPHRWESFHCPLGPGIQVDSLPFLQLRRHIFGLVAGNTKINRPSAQNMNL